jgi:serine phosphatase RsbU (regulator of sigma subunit)/PAS domain-containing protein
MNPEAALGFLAQASGVLAGSLDYERTLAEVARLAVPDVADWCAVDIVEADGSLRQVTSAHADPEQEALLLELRRRYRAEKGAAAGATYAILTGDPILAANAEASAEIQIRDEEADVYRRLGPKSYMIVPLTARGRTIGALTLLSTQPGRHYTEADLDFAQHLSRRFALAIDNARLYDEAERNAAMLDTLFRSVPVGLAFLDGELRPVRANDALGALIAPDDPQLEPLAREVLETGAPVLDRDIEANGRHLLVSLTPVRAVDGTTPGVGVVAIDVTERRETARRNAFLARAGEILESSLDYETTLRNIVRIAVPDIADWCAIHMVDDAGVVRMMAVAHADPERERFAWELDKRFPYTGAEEHGPVAVINSGRSEVNLEVSDELLRASTESEEQYEIARELGLRSSIAVPLRTRGRTIGAITLVAAESGRTLSQRDVELIEELARRAGLAVENAHLYTERSRIAHALQAELLPSSLPDIPGIDVAVRYRAAGELNEVGGDFYDVFECHGGDWALVIGDVSGKGAEAAAVTALARHTVRTASLQPSGPTDLLATLNGALIAQRAGSEFCTVCVAQLTGPQGGASLRLSLGGHPPALVLRAGGGVEAHGEPGTLIGVFPDPALTEVSVELAPGDVLLLYTDGVTEAGPVGEEIGEDGLARILSTLVGQAPEQIVAAVERAAVAAQGGQPRDDIALVALRVDA